MAKGKCISCRIENADGEAKRHPNQQTTLTASWLRTQRRRFHHTKENCRVVTVAATEETPAIYKHRTPVVSQAEEGVQ